MPSKYSIPNLLAGIAALQQEVAYRKATATARESVAIQMTMDAAALAAHDVLGLGPGRAERFHKVLNDYLQSMLDDFREEGDTTEYSKTAIRVPVFTFEQIDRRLRPVFGERFQPWERRYPEASRIYGDEEAV